MLPSLKMNTLITGGTRSRLFIKQEINNYSYIAEMSKRRKHTFSVVVVAFSQRLIGFSSSALMYLNVSFHSGLILISGVARP